MQPMIQATLGFDVVVSPHYQSVESLVPESLGLGGGGKVRLKRGPWGTLFLGEINNGLVRKLASRKRD